MNAVVRAGLEMKKSEVFGRAKRVIEIRGWTQGNLYDAEGAVCLLGALNVALFNDADACHYSTCGNAHIRLPYKKALEDVIEDTTQIRGIANFNDLPDTVVGDVLHILDIAIAEAEKAGE